MSLPLTLDSLNAFMTQLPALNDVSAAVANSQSTPAPRQNTLGQPRKAARADYVPLSSSTISLDFSGDTTGDVSGGELKPKKRPRLDEQSPERPGL